jgi:hypothetical protein
MKDEMFEELAESLKGDQCSYLAELGAGPAGT